MMNFRTIKSNIVTVLGDAAAGRFVTIGYQQQKISAKEAKGNNRIVRIFYDVGDFPKEKGSLNGPVQHDIKYTIELTASSSAKVDVATLNNEASTPAQKAAALVGLKEAAAEADESIDEVWEIVYQILMDARNIDLGSSFTVANRWIPRFKKDETLDDGELVVITGLAELTCSIDEQVTGDVLVPGNKIFDTTTQVNYDEDGNPTSDAGVISSGISSNILFLLQADNEPNGSTNIIDSSQYARPVTPINGAAISTTIKRHGTGSVDVRGTKFLQTPKADWMNFGTGEFLTAAHAYPVAYGSVMTIFNLGTGNSDWTFQIQQVSGSTYRLLFWDKPTGGFYSDNFTLPLNIFSHLAAQRQEDTLTYYLNKAAIGSSIWTENIIAGDQSSDVTLDIGADDYLGGSEVFDGYLDDVVVANAAQNINDIYDGNF